MKVGYRLVEVIESLTSSGAMKVVKSLASSGATRVVKSLVSSGATKDKGILSLGTW